jgi:hypothetical protein
MLETTVAIHTTAKVACRNGLQGEAGTAGGTAGVAVEGLLLTPG